MPRLLAPSLLLLLTSSLAAAPPEPTDKRLVFELVAKEPDIVTPIGIAVDEQSRLWVIENHTHQRPDTYKGPTSDRIRVFTPDGKGGYTISTFADGFKNAMSIALGPDGVVFLATRSSIYRLRDTKGTGTADQKLEIVKLDTKGDYPHNGLSGFAFDGLGDMYFSLGENLGEAYKLIGDDGVTLSGGGEGGSIYRCKLDGSKLERVATGFWNTFHLTFDAFGRLFAVDNDPDARGPCRLLHIIQGGDYGYRFRYGRKGLHPFQAWNGELPGTLPMVAGTAEAPSGIVAYESNGLPKEYIGRLLVTSWGDHVIEAFTLSDRGASFSAKSSVLVRGGEDFRPVGIATAPDGSLYVTDWVDKSYPVHGKGRIWRLRWKDAPKDDGLRASKVAGRKPEELRPLLRDPRREIRAAAATALAAQGGPGLDEMKDVLRNEKDPRARVHVLWVTPVGLQKSFKEVVDSAPEVRMEEARLEGLCLKTVKDPEAPDLVRMARDDKSAQVRLMARLGVPEGEAKVEWLADPDPFLAAAAVEVLSRQRGAPSGLTEAMKSKDPKLRLGVLLVLRRAGKRWNFDVLPQFLDDDDPEVRRAAIQWVAEERLTVHKDRIVRSAMKEPVTRGVFEAMLAARVWLDNPNDSKQVTEGNGETYVAQIVADPKQPPAARAVALRMLRADHPAVKTDLLAGLLIDDDKALRREAARALAQRTDAASQSALRKLAADTGAHPTLRALAIAGLAPSAAASADTRRLLLSLVPDSDLGRDALRSLRDCGLGVDDRRALFAWWDGLPAEKGDPSAGRRELAEQLLLTLGPKPEAGEADRYKAVQGVAGPRPDGEAAWRKALTGRGDAAAGERVFFHARGPRCAVCHRIDGRGGPVGPELSAIARSHNRDKLVESILTPSKEIAPAFTTWVITTRDGKTRTGVIVAESFDSTFTLADADGKLTVLRRLDVEERQASPKSLMPDDLHQRLTRREFLDLLAYLEERK
jgi:putative membrane-bound dehydrogenase-like protein